MLVLGETVGHAFVARIPIPQAPAHAALARTTQNGLALPSYAAVAICFALALAALVRRAAASFQGRTGHVLPSWQLAGVPSVAFIAQEHLESLVHNGELNWLTIAEPTVMLGAVMQLPCGLLALWLVRTLIRAASSARRSRVAAPSAGSATGRHSRSATAGRTIRSGCSRSRARAGRARPAFVRLVRRPRLRGCRSGVEGKVTCKHKTQNSGRTDVDALAAALAERLHLSDGTPWMNTAEAAEYMRVSVRWLRQHLRQMPHSKVEGRLFFSRAELDAWLAGNRRT